MCACHPTLKHRVVLTAVEVEARLCRFLRTVYFIRQRILFCAIQPSTAGYDHEDSEPEEEVTPDNLACSEEGRGMRTEHILRAIVRVPIRWFQLNYHARRLERSINKEHPECPVRVRVVDRLVGNP